MKKDLYQSAIQCYRTSMFQTMNVSTRGWTCRYFADMQWNVAISITALFHLTFSTGNKCPHTQLNSWLHRKPGSLSVVACQTVIFCEVNCTRRNSTEAGTCCVFANASVYLPASISVPLICDPHCLSPCEGPSTSYTQIPKPLCLSTQTPSEQFQGGEAADEHPNTWCSPSKLHWLLLVAADLAAALLTTSPNNGCCPGELP